jgi:hypothetical protein
MKLGIEREGITQSMRAFHLIEYLAEAARIGLLTPSYYRLLLKK